MEPFLSLVTNPFTNDSRAFDRDGPPLVVKARGYAAESAQASHAAFGFLAGGPFANSPRSRRWSTWGAAYGGQGSATGDAAIGSHDRSARTYGFAAGVDYRVTPYTIVGFALGGGGTNYGLSEGLGGGRSEMFQSAAYSLTWINAAYVSTALAFAWHRVSTERTSHDRGHRPPHRRFFRYEFRRPHRGRLPLRHSWSGSLDGIRAHTLRGVSSADVSHALLQRRRRFRHLGFCTDLRGANDKCDQDRSRRLGRSSHRTPP